MGRGKCCVLEFGNLSAELSEEDVGCEVVSTKKLLGVLVDDKLTFAPCLKEVLARGWATFVQMFNTAESAGFGATVLVEEISRRLVPDILFVAALLCSAEGFEQALNRLQWRWGKALLGANQEFTLSWALVFKQCNWPLRLGSLALEKAAVALAKLFLLPEGHPGATFVRMALRVQSRTWVSATVQLLRQGGLPRPIPLIFEGDIFDVDQLQAARRSSKIRKTVLTYYRTQVVRPILLDYDHQACREALAKWLPGLQFSFQDLCGDRPAGNYPPCSFGQGRAANLWYRCWALLRVTGAWPVCLFENNGGLPLCLEKCPACDKREVLPLHVLAECPATLCIWEEAAEILGIPAREQGLRLVAFLVREHPDKRVTLCCQKVVGTSFQLVCSNL